METIRKAVFCELCKGYITSGKMVKLPAHDIYVCEGCCKVLVESEIVIIDAEEV